MYAGLLQQLDSPWEAQQFQVAAAALSVLAAVGSISAERVLQAAAKLGACVMGWWQQAAARCDKACLYRAAAAAVFGTGLQHIASAAAASAAAMAESGVPWTQKAASHLLKAVTCLSTWLLTPLAADHGASAAATQQHLAALLLDDGPAATAARAAAPLHRAGMARALASYAGNAVWRRSDPEMLPPLALAVCTVCTLRNGGGGAGSSQRSSAAEPFFASSLVTECGLQRLHAEVISVYVYTDTSMHLHGSVFGRRSCKNSCNRCYVHCSCYMLHSFIAVSNAAQVTSVARILCRVQGLAVDQPETGGILQAVLQAEVLSV